MQPSHVSKRSSSHTSNDQLATTHEGLGFIRRFQNTLARSGSLPRGSKIIVAVSGGPDSMALLTLLIRLRDKHHFALHVAHVNYQLRGRDSERDEMLVRKYCLTTTTPLTVLHPRTQPKTNIEEQLRISRYRFFERLRTKITFDVIATAHTSDDLAETWLMNLLRGSGFAGLSPFYRQHSCLTRPLKTVAKAELLHFLTIEQIPYRLDRSNAARRFTRNRIRRELIPLLKTFNPQIVSTLTATAERIGSMFQTLDATLPIAIEHDPTTLTFTFSRPAFRLLENAAQRHFLSLFFRMITEAQQSPSARFIDEAARLIARPYQARQNLTLGHLKITCFRDKVDTSL